MRIISWNCQGTSDPRPLVRPHVFWLFKAFTPMFLFLSETKTTVGNVVDLTRGCNPSFICGIDSIGSKGVWLC